LGETIASALAGSVVGHWVSHGELTITASARDIVKVVTFLRDDERCQFVCFIDITATDWPARERRFDVVYHLLSPTHNRRVRVKIEAGEETRVPSIIGVFPGADWFERETYDLYGVLFTGHPDMRRILTDYGFEGHPLRKDFPLVARMVKPWPGIVDVEPMPAVDEEPADEPTTDEPAEETSS
jgi:NADH-quinone oxidoreductase subunit C